MTIAKLRQEYHASVCADIIRIRRSKKKEDYPNFADGDSPPSRTLAWAIVERLRCPQDYDQLAGQTVGRLFEHVTKQFIEDAFSRLQHLRPGKWEYSVGGNIAQYYQYEHLAYIEAAFQKDRILESAFGGDYVVRPDIVIGKHPIPDDQLNAQGILVEDENDYAKLTPIRESNLSPSLQTLHAVISCKWTIRTDRAQNTRTEVLNLIRNRKGHLPHMVAVTAEPWPARIAALALGTGDLDCVYHFALPELAGAVQQSENRDSQELLNVMIEGRRLRDISDLPFDLAV